MSDELKAFKMNLLSRNGSNVYQVEETGTIVTEHKSLVGEYYPLSTKEILNVLDRFGVLKILKSIHIYNTALVNTQAYIQSNKESISLYVNSSLKHTLARFNGKSDRYVALWSLLHETGHLVDPNINKTTSMEYRMTKAEPYADKFAEDNINSLWTNLIKE